MVVPQNEIGRDPSVIAAWATDVEANGFDYLDIFDHVLGGVESHRYGPYTHEHEFHEPFVLYGFLAGKVSIDLAIGVLVLPQRQTALVAKQAAEVDLLSEGRLRLGVGIGWNPVEYQALGKSFRDRGRRMSEQIALLRRLWTEPSVTFDGAYEQVTGAGLSPMPVQRPIPIWIGGASDPAYRRIGQLADGWFPQVRPGSDLDAALAVVAGAAEEAGRDPAVIGMEGRVSFSPDEPDRFVRQVERWRGLGATHLSIDTMYQRLPTVGDHLAALTQASELLGLA